MFYRPQDGHPLPHNPFNAIVTPRPIGWISTRDSAGRNNLAPYSFFNGVAYVPPQVMFASTGTKEDQDNTKDSLANIRETGVFCVNVVESAMRDAMNMSSATLGKDEDEFAHAGLTAIECKTINCPRIDGVPATLECKMTQIEMKSSTQSRMSAWMLVHSSRIWGEKKERTHNNLGMPTLGGGLKHLS